MPLPTLSLAQIQLLVDKGRISPESGRQLQTLSRNGQSATAPAQQAPNNLMGSPSGAQVAPFDLGAALATQQAGQPRIQTPIDLGDVDAPAAPPPGPAPRHLGEVDAPPAAPPAPQPDPNSLEAWQTAAGPGGVRSFADGSNPMALGNENTPTGSGYSIDSKGFVVQNTSTKDQQQGSESGAVVDRMPASDPVAQAHMAEMGQQAAFSAAQKTYKQALEGWKGRVNENFDGYISQPNQGKVELLDGKGDLLERQGNDASSQSTMAGAIQQGMAQRDAAISASHRKELQGKLDEIGKINSELMSTKLDKNHWFSSLGTGTKIFVAVAGILGSGLTKSNAFEDIINRDIAVQKEQFQRKANGLDVKKNLYGQYFSLLKDDEQAMAATRASMKEYSHNMLEAMAAKHGGQQGKANAGIAAQAMRDELGKEQFKLWGMLNPAPAPPAMGGAVGKMPNYERDVTVSLPDGTSFTAANAKSAEELREAVVTREDIHDRIGVLIKLNGDPMTYVPGTAQYNEYQTNANAIKLGADKTALGVARTPEGREFLESSLGIPSQFSAQTVVRLKGLDGRTDNALQTKVRAANGTVIRDGFQLDAATGLPQRKALPTGQTTSAWRLNPEGGKHTPGAPPIPGAKPAGK